MVGGKVGNQEGDGRPSAAILRGVTQIAS
jgi:hypothetical protein